MSHNPATRDPFVAPMPRRNRGTLNLAAAFGRRAKAALRHWQRHRAIRTLQELDGWTLKDIGLARNDIRGFVDDLVAHPPRTVSPAPLVRSSMRRSGPQQLSPTRIGGRFQIKDTNERRQNWDVYQSWQGNRI